MNFFERELAKIAANCKNIRNTKFVGGACIGRLTDEVTVKIQMICLNLNTQYNALHIMLINRCEGCVDKHNIRLDDLWGEFTTPAGNQISPHIWKHGRDIKWYGCVPTSAQFQQLSNAVDEYLECFTEPEQTESEDMDLSI